MKSLLAILLLTLAPLHAFACTNGDNSKILLVIAEADDGEEDKVVGEILTSDGSVQITSRSYILLKSDSAAVRVESLGGHHYVFDRQNAAWGKFCFRAIFGH